MNSVVQDNNYGVVKLVNSDSTSWESVMNSSATELKFTFVNTFLLDHKNEILEGMLSS